MSAPRVPIVWSVDQIALEIVEVEGPEMIVTLAMPTFTIELIGTVLRVGRTLRVRGAHVQGAEPGALLRGGLNAIGRKLLAEADVDEIVIEGSARTTGRNPGRKPRIIRFPR